MWVCCMCGSVEDVKACPLCSHDFCKNCRGDYFHRGIAALEEHLLHHPPDFCTSCASIISKRQVTD